MKTSAPHKLTVNMPAEAERGLRAAACLQTTIGAGFTDGSLAERLLR